MKKRKANSQAESSLEQKSPGKSAVSNDESASEPGRSRNFADCEPVLDAVLNGLSRAEDWKQQRRRKLKRK